MPGTGHRFVLGLRRGRLRVRDRVRVRVRVRVRGRGLCPNHSH